MACTLGDVNKVCAVLHTAVNGTGDITNPLGSYYYGDPYPKGSLWNGPICPLCGVRYLGSHTSCGGISPSNLPVTSRQALATCAHCWCGDPGPFNGKPHVSCCMCKTRRVK